MPHPPPVDFDSPKQKGDRRGKFSFSERGDEDAHVERLILSILVDKAAEIFCVVMFAERFFTENLLS